MAGVSRALRFTPRWHEIAARSIELSGLRVFAAISAEQHEENFFCAADEE